MYKLLLIKRSIEDIFIFPFIMLGRFVAASRPLKKEYCVYFFFPFYHTGGAEKVHAQITAATGDANCVIFFTKRSVDDRFLDDFKKTACTIKDISKYTDNKWLYFFNLVFRGIISGYINSQKLQPLIFNGQCNFAYKISPWIKKDIPQIELIHSLNTFSYIRIPFLPFITRTVMISKKRIEDHKNLYTRSKIPSAFLEKIIYIPNAIVLQVQVANKDNKTFTVLYVGRSTEEKRVHLITEIAKRFYEIKEDVEFEILGDVSNSINQTNFPYVKFFGTLNDEKTISDIYLKAHVLILTSSTEGFPMVIMEAMAHGCIILSTAVGDIPYHVKNNENGFLFSEIEDERNMIKEAVEKIGWLKDNKQEMQRMAINNINYANNNFGIERFNKDYRNLFLSVKTKN
jgi:glycosyltransferase involved in cell wall biosynthesis